MCSQISHEFPPVDVETCIMMLLLMFRAKTKSAKCLRNPLLATLGPLFFNVASLKKKAAVEEELVHPQTIPAHAWGAGPTSGRSMLGSVRGKSKTRNQAEKLWKLWHY